MRKQMVSVTFLLFSLLTSAWAATYVVDQRAPNAADTNPGTRESPFKTIAGAYDVARAGDTVLIRPGIYRESLIPRNSGEPGQPITFRGEPMAREQADHAVIKGSDPVSGFERQSDNLWVKRPWRNPSWYSTEFDSISDDKHKASARLDEVFINERPLRWVPARDQLEPGSFYWSATELAIWPAQPVDDLNEQLVEVPVRWKVAGAWMQDIPRGWNELIEHRNAIVQPAAGARPFNWGSRRYTTLDDLQQNEPQTAFGNAWHDDWRQLSPPQLAKVHQAFGRVVKAILPEELAHLDPAAARLLETFDLSGDGRAVGYLVHAGEPILLIDLHAGGTQRFAVPVGEPKSNVRIFTGLDQTWRDAEATGGMVTMDLSRGVHLVRGLPATVRAGK
jgi:hypothetical protein